jgi:hypothetical protein
MASSRQLAVIMFADIAGYTAMMQEDEVMALQLKNNCFKTWTKKSTGIMGEYLVSEATVPYVASSAALKR